MNQIEIDNLITFVECIYGQMTIEKKNYFWLDNLASFRIHFKTINNNPVMYIIFDSNNISAKQVFLRQVEKLDSVFKYMVEYLASSNILTYLSIENIPLDNKTLEQLLLFVSTNHSVKTLELENCLNGNFATVLVCGLGSNIRALNIRSNDINIESMTTMIHCFREKTNIQSLNISDHIIDHDAMEKIIILLNINKNLNSLSIRNCQLGQKIDCLFNALKNNNSLTYLDVAENNITDVSQISEFIQTNRTLQYLNLSYNSLGDNLIALFRALTYNKTLMKLNICGESMDARHLNELIDSLALNNTLVTIEHTQYYDRDSEEYGLRDKVMSKLLLNKKLTEDDILIKKTMLMLRQNLYCIISLLPRRLLIYLLTFI